MISWESKATLVYIQNNGHVLFNYDGLFSKRCQFGTKKYGDFQEKD